MFDRLKTLFTKKALGNSMGVVARNYAKRPTFEPERQVTGITYKAIDKIGLTLSVYQPLVTKRNGDAYVNHPLITLFDHPNPIQKNGSDFIHLYAMLMEIYGETFWYLARGESTRRVKEVYLLNPSQVELKFYNGELIGYVLHKSNGTQVPLMLEEVVHDKRPNPFNEWRGMSVVERAAVYIDTEITTAVFTLNYIKNNASPSGIVSLPEMEKEAFKQFTQQWREGYEGPENAGKTAFIRGGEASFKAVGATLKDIDQKITREMSKDDVLMMLDVPKPLLGMTDDVGFGRGNVETLKLIFAESKLEPMMRRLDRIYEQIVPLVVSGAPTEITHESPIPDDKEYRLKLYETAVNKWMTPNEIRSHYGLEPLPEGDDLQTENLIRPAENRSVSTRVKLKKAVKLSKADETRKINEEQEAFRSKLVDTNELYVKKIKSNISTFAGEQEKLVIEKINATSKSYEEWLFNVKDDSEKLAAALMPIFVELMEAQAADVANFITGELLTISPEMRKVVEAEILKISGIYNEETLKTLEKTLTAGQAEGESLAKLKKRVESVFSEAKGYRAERIARTESLRVSNTTAEESYKQNGFNKVEWFINPGACEFCRTYSGRSREIGSKFNTIGDVVSGDEGGQLRIDYSDINVPPLHPNCTCSLVPAE